MEVENEGVERVGSRSKEEKRCAFRGFGRIRRRRWLIGDARVCDGGRRNERWWSGRMDLIGGEEG